MPHLPGITYFNSIAEGATYPITIWSGIRPDSDRVQLYPDVPIFSEIEPSEDNRIRIQYIYSDSQQQSERFISIVRRFPNWPIWIDTDHHTGTNYGDSAFYYIAHIGRYPFTIEGELAIPEDEGREFVRATPNIPSWFVEFRLKNVTEEGASSATIGLSGESWDTRDSVTIREMYFVTNPGRVDSDGVTQKGASTYLEIPRREDHGSFRVNNFTVVNRSAEQVFQKLNIIQSTSAFYNHPGKVNISLPGSDLSQVVEGVVGGIDIGALGSSDYEIHFAEKPDASGINRDPFNLDSWKLVEATPSDTLNWRVTLQRNLSLPRAYIY